MAVVYCVKLLDSPHRRRLLCIICPLSLKPFPFRKSRSCDNSVYCSLIPCAYVPRTCRGPTTRNDNLTHQLREPSSTSLSTPGYLLLSKTLITNLHHPLPPVCLPTQLTRINPKLPHPGFLWRYRRTEACISGRFCGESLLTIRDIKTATTCRDYFVFCEHIRCRKRKEEERKEIKGHTYQSGICRITRKEQGNKTYS